MNYGEVIQAWRDDTRWIDGKPNPYVKRDVESIIMNPIEHGEIIARFVIIDNTLFAERQELPFRREMIFCSSHLKGSQEERDDEAMKLQQELENFLLESIEARQREINSYRQRDINILTTNPYGW